MVRKVAQLSDGANPAFYSCELSKTPELAWVVEKLCDWSTSLTKRFPDLDPQHVIFVFPEGTKRFLLATARLLARSGKWSVVQMGEREGARPVSVVYRLAGFLHSFDAHDVENLHVFAADALNAPWFLEQIEEAEAQRATDHRDENPSIH